MDPVEALQRLGGIAALGELIGPTTRKRLRAAVADGRVCHLGRDKYGLVDLAQQHSAAVAAGGVMSHLSAAVHWGWPVQYVPVRPWVTIPRGRARPPGDLEVRRGLVPDAEQLRHVTRHARTVVDCARALPFSEALSVADSALRSGAVTRAELEWAVARSPRTGRSRASAVVDAADPRAANPFESALRAIALGVEGLQVEPQGEVPGVGWVDLLDRRLGIVIEAESFEFHGTKAALRRDVTRYTACTRRGLVVARFLWEEVMHHPDEVAAALADVVAWRWAKQAG